MDGDKLQPALQGRRILIVEDELLLAIELEKMLQEEGCVVVGPASRVAKALTALERERPDAAVLDFDLNGEPSTPVARALAEREIPFVVVTGCGEAAAAEPALRRAPHLRKPVDRRTLACLLARLTSVPSVDQPTADAPCSECLGYGDACGPPPE